VWDKGGGGLGSYYQNNHELISFAVRTPRSRVKEKDTGHRVINGEPNIWEYTPPTYQDDDADNPHTANKPVEMFERAISNSTEEDDSVLEPFAGGGSCIAAAESQNRICYAMEIDPSFVAVCLERFSKAGMDCELISS